MRTKRTGHLLRLASLLSLMVSLFLSVSPGLAQTTTPTPGPGGFQATTSTECPNVPPGSKWRIASKTTQRTDGKVALCIQIVAGDEAIDLSNTITVNLPQGVSVIQDQSEKGQVTAANSTIRWGSFGLNASESSSLLLVVSAADLNNLKSTTIMIEGRFTRGQSFQGLIPGLAPLTEVEVSDAGMFQITQLPNTGFGPAADRSSQDGSAGLWLALLILTTLSGVGLITWASLRPKRR